MSSDGNSTGNDRGGHDGNSLGEPGTIVAIVALAVSLIALVGTTLQVLQQYFASAAGYSNCGEKVIGEWHKSKKRKFVWEELRFEVQFETPVIFVCPPANKKGPVKDTEVAHINGTDDSLRATRTKLISTDDQAKPAAPADGFELEAGRAGVRVRAHAPILLRDADVDDR